MLFEGHIFVRRLPVRRIPPFIEGKPQIPLLFRCGRMWKLPPKRPSLENTETASKAQVPFRSTNWPEGAISRVLRSVR